MIHQFKQGYYNVLVATSIGEEGLDIGEIDLIVCYDTVKDSVRMVSMRAGRMYIKSSYSNALPHSFNELVVRDANVRVRLSCSWLQDERRKRGK